MAKFTIREADQNDISGIVRLRHSVREFRDIDRDEYISFWNSQIYNNPYSIRHALVGLNKKNEVVAHLAMVPYRFLKDGKSLLGGSLCQLMVHEDFRQELLYPRLEWKILSGYKGLGIDFSFGMANRGEVMNAHLSFGYRRIGDLAVYATPYKFGRIARRLIKNNILNVLLSPGLYMAEKLLRLKRSSGKQALGVTEISGFDSEIDHFLVNVQKHFPISALRNSAILNWRFSSSHAVKYHILITREEGEILGYAVLRRMEMKGFNVLAIADIMFPPDRIDAGRSLINAVHRTAIKFNVELSACLLSPHDPLCPVLRKYGYFKTPETFSLIVHEPKGEKPRFSENSFDKWHLTWFDHDAV